MKLKQQIELSVIKASVSNTSYAFPVDPNSVQYKHSYLLNPANFTGGTYYFEAVIKSDGTNALSVQLYNETTGALVSGTEVSSTASGFTRVRSAAFTPATGDNEYDFQLKIAGGSGEVTNVRIIVIQDATNILATETVYELGTNEITSGSIDAPEFLKSYLHETAYRDGTVSMYLEATLSRGNGATTGATTVQLYDYDAFALVSGASVSVSAGTAAARVRSSDILSLLTAGEKYAMHSGETSNGSNPTVFGARLIIRQTHATALTKIQLPLYSNLYNIDITTSYVDYNGILNFDPADFDPPSGAIAYYLEAALSGTAGEDSTAKLRNKTDSTDITTVNVDHSDNTQDKHNRTASAISLPASSKELTVQLIETFGGKSGYVNVLALWGTQAAVQITDSREARTKGIQTLTSSRSTRSFGGYAKTYQDDLSTTNNKDAGASSLVEWTGDGEIRLQG